MDPVDRTPYTSYRGSRSELVRPKHPKRPPRAFGASAPAGLHSLSHTEQRPLTLTHQPGLFCYPSARPFSWRLAAPPSSRHQVLPAAPQTGATARRHLN
jgi:hypothetical protein